MPLESGSSKAAFSHNVKTEMTEGNKPQKQAVAIAYAKQRGDSEKIDAIADGLARVDSVLDQIGKPLSQRADRRK